MTGQDHAKPSAAGSGSTAPGTPLWEAISRDLQRRLQKGEFSDGFPGELALANEYGASRGSIRAALRPLREAGLVTAQRGRKPVALPQVVAGKSTAYGPVYSLFATLQEAGMEHYSDVLAQEVGRNEAVAQRLMLPADEPLFHLSRRRYADGVPLALDDVWLPAEQVGPLLERDFSNTALYQELEEACGISLDGGEERLTAVIATEEQARSLQCTTDTALLLIDRVGYAGGRPLEYRRSYIVGGDFAVSTSFGSQAQ
ncbi:GntR family transcriptional regulator [Arthrobacter sp. VKM Ac-2550]|uniref:GntR family transcriptional regulator n=1 Tax=Crystallibacter permensis TaxID=1938888 RepID=UPI0022273848|nr:GntR family transcriptional regulator [Arthrobacter sp. VKM Ac-2550]MCW2135286.1 GntR family transcriptional regulator [Arthrobacter sp. VKM Ac-2550]